MPIPDLREYADVHTHRLDAGPSAVINLPWGAPVPSTGAYSVGIHPWDAASATEADFERLEALASHTSVVAIGETGIDALRGGPIEVQEAVFRRHAAISEAVGKPLIIHSVRATDKMIALRRELGPAQRWIIHGFRGKPQLAAQLVRAGFDISLGEKFNPGVPDAVPRERLHRETD